MDQPRAIWRRLAAWATLWELPPPRISAGWVDLPRRYAGLARDGWIQRPMLEPAASAADEVALVDETGLALPHDLRALHDIHDGSFAPLLPQGMTLLPYQAIGTTWRSLVRLVDELPRADDDDDEVAEDQTHLACLFHRRWLPIAASDELNLCLDFVPGPAGTMGQVLMQINEADYAVVAHSTLDFLARWLRLLDAGLVRFDRACGHAVPAADREVESLLRDVV